MLEGLKRVFGIGRRTADAERLSALSAEAQRVLDSWIVERSDTGVTYEPPDVDPRAFGVRLVRGEELLAVIDGVRRFEYRSTGSFALGMARVRLPIMKGVSLQGYRGKVSRPKEWVEADQGRLIITTNAIGFDGATRNLRTTLGQILDAEYDTGGIQVEPKKGPVQRYLFEVQPIHAAALTYTLTISDPSQEAKTLAQKAPPKKESAPFDDAVRTDEDGVKVYEID